MRDQKNSPKTKKRFHPTKDSGKRIKMIYLVDKELAKPQIKTGKFEQQLLLQLKIKADQKSIPKA